MSSRQVGFVDHIDLDFSGNVVQKAILLGQLRGQESWQLAIGSVDGNLGVFWGDCPKPWLAASDLGTITVLAAGPLFHTSENFLVVIAAEGTAFVFDLRLAPPRDASSPLDAAPLVWPYAMQFALPSNVTTAAIGDVDCDGLVELVVGSADRSVSVYRMTEAATVVAGMAWAPSLVAQWYLPGIVTSISLLALAGEMVILVAQPGGAFFAIRSSDWRERAAVFHGQAAVGGASPSIDAEVLGLRHSLGPFVCLLTVDGSIQVVSLASAGAPVGGSASAQPQAHTQTEQLSHFSSSESLSFAHMPTPATTPSVAESNALFARPLASPTVAPLLAPATASSAGASTFLRVDHRLLGLASLDIDGDGDDELIAPGWDGTTYIVDPARGHTITFDLHERVCAFAAGRFSLASATPRCLVYVTFDDRIKVFVDVSLPAIGKRTMLDVARARGLNMTADEVREALRRYQRERARALAL